MESKRFRHRRFYSAHYLPNLPDRRQSYDEGSLSLKDVNDDFLLGLDYLATNVQTFFNKNPSNSLVHHKDSKRTGWIINGSFFDEQLFQLNRSSCVTDYSETPADLSRFIQGHQETSVSSSLDVHLFKLAFILTLNDDEQKSERLIDYCPHQDRIVEEIDNYKPFCFPELRSERRTNFLEESSTYVFTRTLSNGHMEYGYCRRFQRNHHRFPIVLCIVSSHSYFKLYDNILNELLSAYRSNEGECSLLMQSFYSKPLPQPTLNSSGIVCILNNRRVFFYICPRDDRLNHDYFFTLLSCLSASHIVHLFEAILTSKRLLFFSHSLAKLSKACLALTMLMSPLIWPYAFVSLMPTTWLHDLLGSPCPYIYGCLNESKEHLPVELDHDVLQINLDFNTLEGNLDEICPLPANLRQTLETSLVYLKRFRLIKCDSTLINLAVSEACLTVLVELLHRVPDYYSRHKSPSEHFAICSDYFESLPQQIEEKNERHFDYDFDAEEFLNDSIVLPYRDFLHEFIHGMIFFKFLDDFQRHGDIDLFSQRLNERRQRTNEDLLINPSIRFQQTFDLLEKQLKKLTKPTFTKLMKKVF